MNIDPKDWPLQTPFGPMRHRDTGETYQGMNVRLEQEHRQRQAQQENRASRPLAKTAGVEP